MEHSDASLAFGRELEVEIEGPKDDNFLSRRQQENNDAESGCAMRDVEPDGGARGDCHGRNEEGRRKGKDPGAGDDAEGIEGA